MEWIVAVFGAYIAAAGVWILVRPRGWNSLVEWAAEHLGAVAAIRVTGGGLLLFAASSCRSPELIYLVGGISILSGAVVLLMGSDQMRGMADWFTALPTPAIRLWGLFALGFGVLMVHAAGVAG